MTEEIEESEYVYDLSRMLDRAPSFHWYAFDTASGKRSKPHAFLGREGNDAVFACGLRFCAWPVGNSSVGLYDIATGTDVFTTMYVLDQPQACKACAHEVRARLWMWYATQSLTRIVSRPSYVMQPSAMSVLYGVE